MEKTEPDNRAEPDEKLLDLTAAGDREAFSQLATRHQDWVFRLAFRYTRHRQDAEELTQEIFLRAWRHARQFRGDSSFSTWLYRLAVNCCLNHRQSKKVRPDPLPIAAGHAAADGQGGDEMVLAERQARLHAAMASLPTRQRLALTLASFEDKSYEEIAAAMGTSVSAIESLLFRARQNLAAVLRPMRERGEL